MSSTAKKPKTSTERMAAYRKRMRDAGLRPVQIWVPDVRSPEFIAKARRQAQSVARRDPGGDDIMAWLDEVRDWPTD